MITLSTLIEQTAQLSLSGFKQSLEFQSEDTSYQSLSLEERLYSYLKSNKENNNCYRVSKKDG